MDKVKTGKRPNKYRPSKLVSGKKLTGRSKLTNGNTLLPGTDGRSIWARRFRDLIVLHVEDRGGEEQCSQAELALTRRAACLITELERMEVKFSEQGGAKRWELETYQRASNTLRRLLESLGLKREVKNVTPNTHEPTFKRFLEHLENEP